MHLVDRLRTTRARTMAVLFLPNSMMQYVSPMTWIGVPFAVEAVTVVGATMASDPKVLSSTRVRLLPVSARHITMRPFTRPFAVS